MESDENIHSVQLCWLCNEGSGSIVLLAFIHARIESSQSFYKLKSNPIRDSHGRVLKEMFKMFTTDIV